MHRWVPGRRDGLEAGDLSDSIVDTVDFRDDRLSVPTGFGVVHGYMPGSSPSKMLVEDCERMASNFALVYSEVGEK